MNGLNLNSEYIDAIQQFCPFWDLVKLILGEKITSSSTRKSDKELAVLIEHYNKETKTFEIGGKSIDLSKDDVVSVFGVKGGGEKVVHSYDKCIASHFYKNFNGAQNLNAELVLQTLKESVKVKGIEAANNVAQVVTLYMLTTIFAPTKGHTLSWGYTKCLHVVENINSYDWPAHIYECVIANFVDRKSASVFLDDMYDLIGGRQMFSRVMDAHGEILMEMFNKCTERKIIIFESNIWKFIKSMDDPRDHDASRRVEFDTAVDKAAGVGLWLFPITTNSNKIYKFEPNHWMLLVHDTEANKWKLYNSKQPRGARNPYKKDAELLKNYVEKKFMIGWHDLYIDELSDPSMAAQNNTQENKVELKEPKYPQQDSRGVDCGTYVC